MNEKYYQKGFGLKKEVAGSIEKEYHSCLIDFIKASAYQITSGKTTVMLAREFGFCYGVDRSVDYAYQTLEKFPDKRIYLTGEIIHNPFVNDKLLKAGIKFLSGPHHKGEKIEDIQPEDIVILPAFGVSIPMLEQLKKRQCILVDTTCGSVLVVWKHVERFSGEGYTAVVHGKYYHEESIATVSRAGAKYIIVRDITEAQKVCAYIQQGRNKEGFITYFEKSMSPGFDPDRDLKKVGFANQTTMLAGESLRISAMLEEALISRYGKQNISSHFRSFDTICSATQDRQDAIIEMLEKDPDLTIIIGGFNSSNTKSLTSIAQKYAPAYHIEDAAHLIDSCHIKNLPAGQSESTISENWLPDKPLTLAVTAGASTPDAKIGEVIEKIFLLRREQIPAVK